MSATSRALSLSLSDGQADAQATDLATVGFTDTGAAGSSFDAATLAGNFFAAPGLPSGPLYLGDAIGDTIGTATTLAIGASVSSLIDNAGDLDFFQVTLQAGQAYTFSLARGAGGGGLPDAYLELRDSTGALVAEDDDGGISTNSFLMHTAESSGTYYVVARGYDAAAIGAYTLSTAAITTGLTSPTPFTPNTLPFFSWEQAGIQISRDGSSWASNFGQAATVSYSFRSTAPTTMPDTAAGFTRFTDVQIIAAEAALQAWGQVANINFVRIGSGTSGEGAYSDAASIIFANYSSGVAGAAAFAYQPNSGNTASGSLQGDVWVNSSLSYNQIPVAGEYGQQVLLHEIGHAIGLAHPADYNAGDGVVITYDNDATFYQDSRLFTVMSYFASAVIPNSGIGVYASTPQLYDIAAIQRLYGANMTTRTGDTVYGFNSNSGRVETTLTSSGQTTSFAIWDGGGTDTLDLSGYTTNSLIDLREEAFSTAGPGPIGGAAVNNISIARGAVIENAIGGSGNDTIIGNSVANVLTGNGGGDMISGGAGADTLLGGAGNDVLDGGSGGDTINGGADFDTVSYSTSTSAVTVRLTPGGAISGGYAQGDKLIGIEGLIGSAYSDVLIGQAGVANTINGGAGDDYLDGISGNNTLIGGAGKDRLMGGAGSDIINGGADFDTVNYSTSTSAVTVRLTPGGAISGGYAQGDKLISIEGLIGSAYSDVLIGQAGVANTIDGGAGDDYLDGISGNNTLIGGAGKDRLMGGAGSDIINGGADFDTVNYSTSTSAVTVRLTPGGAISGGYAQGDKLISIEGLIGSAYSDVLIGQAGVANTINGGAGDDYLDGISGNNTLIGGAGKDRLMGGAGSDIINGGADFDTVNYSTSTSAVTVRLTPGGAISGGYAQGDKLIGIEGLIGSAYSDVLIGQAGVANTLDGGAGNDYLDGLSGGNTLIGGAGADRITAGAGADRIVLRAASDSTLALTDTVKGFTHGQDVIDVTAIRTGGLDTFQLVVVGADTRLEIDLGGNGSVDTVVLLTGVTNLDSGDIVWTSAPAPLIAEKTPDIAPTSPLLDVMELLAASGAKGLDGEPLVLPGESVSGLASDGGLALNPIGGPEFAASGDAFSAHGFHALDAGPGHATELTLDSIWADAAFDPTLPSDVWGDMADRHSVTGTVVFEHAAIL